jgi:uncharacterized tellurite resistance protein B-like protein
MIEKLQQILRKHLGHGEESRDDGQELQLATATLLMEVARADDRITEEERQDVRRLIEKHYACDVPLSLYTPDQPRLQSGRESANHLHVMAGDLF